MSWRFQDVEKLAVAYLSAATDAEVSVSLPPDIDDRLPFVRVTRGPGSDDSVTDSPLLDVEALAADRDGASDLAEDCRDAMGNLGGHGVNGVTFDAVETATGPTYVAYSETIDRYVASYRLHLRGK